MTKLVTIDVTLVHQTDLAVLVESAETGRQGWVPKSVIELYEDGTATLPETMAAEKELI